MKERILIIDDNFKLCKRLARNFEQRDYNPLYATSGKEALSLLSKQQIDIVLLDMMLGEENGLDMRSTWESRKIAHTPPPFSPVSVGGFKEFRPLSHNEKRVCAYMGGL
jgi:DNA-binding response OmpR family regulator